MSNTINSQIQQGQDLYSDFIEKLMGEAQDPSVTPENRAQMKEVLINELDEELNAHLVNVLAEKDRILLEELLNTHPNNDQIGAFLMEKIPNFQAEVTVCLLNFRSSYLSGLGINPNAQPFQENKEITSSEDLSLVPPPAN